MQDDCFSFRLMWATGGAVQGYVYALPERQDPAFWELPDTRRDGEGCQPRTGAHGLLSLARSPARRGATVLQLACPHSRAAKPPRAAHAAQESPALLPAAALQAAPALWLGAVPTACASCAAPGTLCRFAWS